MTKTTTATPVARPAPRTLREYFKGPPRVSQRQLARRAGCAQSMLSMLARGDRRPGAALAVKLHKLTGVPLAQLLAPRRRSRKVA